ncbi:hypothetical protein C8R44DRAFT_982120, partial [Mycena epipterygia]
VHQNNQRLLEIRQRPRIQRRQRGAHQRRHQRRALEAAARDIKAYLSSISSSALVGYADIDGASSFRDAVSSYLSCDPTGKNDGSTSIDIFGVNNYEWCGNASSRTFNGINAELKDYNVVAYFSEFGFRELLPRCAPLDRDRRPLRLAHDRSLVRRPRLQLLPRRVHRAPIRHGHPLLGQHH